MTEPNRFEKIALEIITRYGARRREHRDEDLSILTNIIEEILGRETNKAFDAGKKEGFYWGMYGAIVSWSCECCDEDFCTHECAPRQTAKEAYEEWLADEK